MAAEPLTTPIAIIGMGCRFAGDATDPEKLWKLLEQGQSACSEIPHTRFNVKGVYHPNGERIGSTHVTAGHFLQQDVALFDTSFFNMSSDVASVMDPQYRLMLQVVYESLESAGLPLENVAGSNTSVYGGVMFRDNHDSHSRDPDTLPRYFMTGNASTMASNRVSHFFDLRGPSMTVDTGCSTTLTALHLALQNLRAGESDMSIVTGASLMLNPDIFLSMSNLGFLSPDGRSYAFDSRANGYGRGEGVASIVIKRLDDALRDGDAIRAIIRETALNQDGKTATITAPDSGAQERLIRECYQAAGLDPSQTAYVEAHGTGTPIGDPLEIAAISAAFKSADRTEKLLVGSVKSTIGHTEAASGLASVIKAALALEKGLVPPNADFQQPNPKLELGRRNISVPASMAQPWGSRTSLEQPRRASVNNFGFGGSNAHAILERYNPGAVAATTTTGGWQSGAHEAGPCNGYAVEKNATQLKHRVYVLSAKDDKSCLQMALDLKEHLVLRDRDVVDPDGFLDSLAYTLGSRRSRFPWSVAVSASSLDELVQVLDPQSGRCKPVRADQGNGGAPCLGMVFTGQGAQWYAMGRELLEAYPVFKEAILECDGYIQEMGATWTIMEEMTRDAADSRVNEAQFSLPLSTAVQIALVRLLRSWGIAPAAISSHSSGEVAAAYAGGALTCRSAIGITYIRGRMTVKSETESPSSSGKNGAMMAVGLSRGQTNAYISRVCEGRSDWCLTVACVNSPSSVTVSGDEEAVASLEGLLVSDKVFARRLKVTEAFHSEHMRPMANLFGAGLLGLLQQPGDTRDDSVAFFSPKTGGRLDKLDVLAKPLHWVESMLQPVEFESAFSDMCFGLPGSNDGQVDMILEVGPHGALGGPIQQIMADRAGKTVPYMSCLSRGKSAVFTMHKLATELLQWGHRLDMDAVNFPGGRSPEVHVLPGLPTYPWNNQNRYLIEPRINKSFQRPMAPHDLVGSRELTSPASRPTWRHVIRVADIPWTRHHVVDSKMVYPGAGFLCMAIQGFSQAMPGSSSRRSGFRLQDVEFSQALVVPDDHAGIETRLEMRPCSHQSLRTRDWYEFEISSVTGDGGVWTRHCTGLIRSAAEDDATIYPGTAAWRDTQAYTRDISPEDLWAALRKVGIHHSPPFQNIMHIRRRHKTDESLTSFSVANTAAEMPKGYESSHVVHPTTLDSVLQAGYTALPTAGTAMWMDTALVPRRIKSLSLYLGSDGDGGSNSYKGLPLHVHTYLKQSSSRSFAVDIGVRNSDGLQAEMRGLEYQSLGQQQQDQVQSPHQGCISWKWGPDMTLLSRGWLRDQMKTPVDASEVELMQELARCTIHYCQEAIEALETAGDRVDQLAWHHQRLHTWMSAQVEAAAQGKLKLGVGREESAGWLADSAEERAALRTRVARASVNGEMLTRLGGANMLAMLRGQAAPLQLMMEDKLLSRYYVGALKWHRASTQAAQLVRHAAHKNPRARVLEIGGGTGGCTQVILDGLAGQGATVGRYDFTDVSSGFFEAARERFAAWAGVMDWRRLDIEADPAGQGFERGSYDVVVACQVLHATSDVRRTLRHARSLLRPGGKLVLVETTNDQLDLFFTFGLLPGWWLSEEPERRLSPSLAVPFWDQVLRETGLGGVELEVRDCESSEYYMVSTILATRVDDEDDTHSALVPSPSVCIVVGGDATGTGSPSSSSPSPPSEWIHQLQSDLTAAMGGRSIVASLDTLQTEQLTGKYCVFLGEINTPVLSGAQDAKQFDAVVSMATQCKGLLWVTRGAVDTFTDEVDPNGQDQIQQQPWASLSLGFLRTLRNEHGDKRYLSLDLDPSGGSVWTGRASSAIVRVLQAGSSSSPSSSPRESDFEYAERAGVIHVPRARQDAKLNAELERLLVPLTSNPTSVDYDLQPFRTSAGGRPLRMDIATPGLIDTLFFRRETPQDQASSCSPLPAGWVEIEPRAFGLNFRDVMVAMGQLEANRVMGFECAGVVTALGPAAAAALPGLRVGDSVCALLRGHWATRARTPWTSVMRMPQGLGFVQAASLALVFATAYVALEETARVREGDTVLVHAGAGGVGQAAIMLAQRAGARVLATAGSDAKRALLADRFGLDPKTHIFSSRDAGFAARVMAATGGKGVDVVLNSLSGTLLQASFDCMAEFGRFVDIGKRDFEQGSRLDMGAFARGCSFSSLDLLTWQARRGEAMSRVMGRVAELLASGGLSPVSPITTYPISDIEKAFRVMQSGQHMGKIVVTVDGEKDLVRVGNTDDRDVGADPKSLRPDASYLVVGGAGGLGRCVLEWLILHGARHLIVLSRTASSSREFLEELVQETDQEVQIQHAACDISDRRQLHSALDTCRQVHKMPPVRGVIQAAMVLQDSLVTQMTAEDFRAATLPKVQGSWNLHVELGGGDDDGDGDDGGHKLDFFIMLSSLVGVMGAAGQANYAAGCAFQDALAAQRRARGQAGVSIDLGMVRAVGYVAKAQAQADTAHQKTMKKRGGSVADRLARLGFRALGEDDMTRILDVAIFRPDRCPPNIITGINTGPGAHWAEAEWMAETRFASLDDRDKASFLLSQKTSGASSSSSSSSSAGGARSAGSRLQQGLSEAASLGAAVALVLEALAHKLAGMFGLGDDRVSGASRLSALGVDSLVAVELRNWIFAQMAADVPIFDLVQDVSLAELAESVVNKSTLVDEKALGKQVG